MLKTAPRRGSQESKGTRETRAETETLRELDVSTARSSDMFLETVPRRGNPETSSQLSAISAKDLVIWLELVLLKISKLIFEL